MTELQRYDGPGDPPALRWKPPPNSAAPRYRTLIACPSGHVKTLVEHVVSAAGDVNPSVRCPLCKWHQWVRLAGWRS